MDRLVNGCYTLLILGMVETVIQFQASVYGTDEDVLFRMDMISFGILGTPAVILALWFFGNNVIHKKRTKALRENS